ncbi:DUF3307 domain-containing protein [Streptomyces sp. ADI95-17]|uniref:DUF3307 domain-containing protein n=1 Tax=Streptomyces sp. ADI95-17 TaxID=1522759 RepID=UPI000F9E46E0|nr:DUF3307 domain-containing protein [Streptomyces sp. ADI95-17]RPK53943.1 hypothetical protein EES42_43860 [Streptomyces sp. ADI95-17]
MRRRRSIAFFTFPSWSPSTRIRQAAASTASSRISSTASSPPAASSCILLYVAHLAADYALQTDRKAGWIEGPKDPTPGRYHHGWGENLAHAGTHVLVTAVALGAGTLALSLPLTIPAATAALLWIGTTHGIIDRRWPVLRNPAQ